jgi:hypothetical protein
MVVLKNKCPIYSVIITCSPQMISGFMEVILQVQFVAKTFMLAWTKTSSGGKLIAAVSGADLGYDVELMLQVLFDTNGKLNASSSKPKVVNEHFPFQKATHMETHPTSSPAITRMCTVRAASCTAKFMNKEGKPVNLSEKSQDLCAKLVSRC